MVLSGQIYRCSAGETYDGIAFDVYGDEKYASELMTANPEYGGIDVFAGGERLRLPVIEEPEAAEERTVFMPAVAPWKEA